MSHLSAATGNEGRRLSPVKARATSRTLFHRLAALERGTPEHRRVRNSLVELNMALVHFTAARFRSRGVPYDDLLQVGTVGLIKAVDRFDPQRAVEFATFAVPTVREIQHYLRDTTWAVRVPRRVRDLRLRMITAHEELIRMNGRAPSAAELAAHIGIEEREIRKGELASHAYAAYSLDAQIQDDSDARVALQERIGALDPAMEGVENLIALRSLVRKLPDRERAILFLRFCAAMTQSEIGAELGLSQMHISRLLARTLARLREGMLADV